MDSSLKLDFGATIITLVPHKSSKTLMMYIDQGGVQIRIFDLTPFQTKQLERALRFQRFCIMNEESRNCKFLIFSWHCWHAKEDAPDRKRYWCRYHPIQYHWVECCRCKLRKQVETGLGI